MEVLIQNINNTIQPMRSMVLTEEQQNHFNNFEELYKSSFDLLKTTISYNFYIKKINGILVDVCSCVENEELTITIKSRFQEYVLCNFKIQNAFDLFMCLFVHFGTLSYNKFYNIFELPSIKQKVFEYDNLVVKNDNVEMEYNECCVCLEETMCYIENCNHSLCLVCETHIKNNLCPLCRQDYNL